MAIVCVPWKLKFNNLCFIKESIEKISFQINNYRRKIVRKKNDNKLTQKQFTDWFQDMKYWGSPESSHSTDWEEKTCGKSSVFVRLGHFSLNKILRVTLFGDYSISIKYFVMTMQWTTPFHPMENGYSLSFYVI